jgi:predicted nucleotidyltransferase
MNPCTHVAQAANALWAGMITGNGEEMSSMEKYNAQLSVTLQHKTLAQKYGERNVFVTMLYGSQNYNMQTPSSDVDTKAMVLPSFGDFTLKEKWLSVEETFAEGLSTVKDVRGMCENFLKSNLNFLECLYTNYYEVNYHYAPFWYYLRDNADLLGDAHPFKLMHAAAGMAQQKYHALEKPFESKAEILTKYGYDPKQLHHLCRLSLFMLNYSRRPVLRENLTMRPQEHDWLMSLKTHPLPLEEARKEAEHAMNRVNALREKAATTFDKNPQSAAHAKDLLQSFCLSLLREHLVYELQSGAEL